MDFGLPQVLNLSAGHLPRVITIEENGFIDAGFCVGAILKECYLGRKIVFVLHHHGFGHYQGIATKLGYSLEAVRDSGNLVVVDVMSEFGVRIQKGSFDLEEMLNSVQQRVSEVIADCSDQEICVIFEHPGNVDLGFGDTNLVLLYTRNFGGLVEKNRQVRLICVTSGLSSLTVLNCVLKRLSDLVLIVRGLATGSAADISGSISLMRSGSVDKFHYQLMERKIRLFAPGTVQIRGN